MAINKSEVQEIFSHWEAGQPDKFFNRLAEDFEWTVMGTHPLAGVFKGKEAYMKGAFNRLSKVLKDDVRLEVIAIYVDGQTAVVELKSFMTAINGHPYHNSYCWIVRFDEEKQISAITAYLDSALLKQIIEENE
ncbi:nuclear transport factor 2 family protein [Sneathiella marina]|uniref:Nuclear transport factor 2 family protein n=1 Tax=Sneathiella marina TaxID=2950108 RepID=A0ABY4W628_9PROT|nr:nuclear transport factor 2 family protein [Sneathiella marina]USG61150.1 nuclear transport factor 2 family protein [Sneathiella marina]